MSKFAILWDLNGVLFKKRVLDESTLAIVEKLNSVNVDQYICTNTKVETLELWIKEFGIDKYFKGIFSTREIGYLKPDARLFKHIKMGLSNKRLLLIDDSYINIKVARIVGLKGIRYVSDKQLLNELKMLNIYMDDN